MKSWSLILVWAIGILLMHSCKDAYDFSTDKLAGSVEQTTEIALPLIDADITIEELLPDNDATSMFLNIDNDGFITLTYEDNIAVVSAPEMFDGNYSGTLPGSTHDEAPQEVPLNMNELINQGRFYFADPKMTISIKNYWNVSARFRFNEFQYFTEEGGTGIPLTGSAITDWHDVLPSGTEEFVITEIALNRTNSNIDEVISSMPYSLSAGATIETPPGTYGPNDIDPDSEDSVSLKIEMPMDLLIEDLVQLDTAEFNLLSDYEDDSDAVNSLSFNLAVDNGFPVDLSTQIYFVDDNYLVLDSISNDGINIVAGNSENGTNNPVESIEQIVFDQSKISNIVKAKHLLMRIVINTKNAASNETIKLYTNYSIAVKLGGRAEVDLKLDL